VEEVEEEEGTAATEMVTAADVPEEEDVATAMLQQLWPNTKVYVLPLAIMFLIMARREQLTRCEQLGRRLYITLVRSTAMISATNCRIVKLSR
jgi:xanthine dehydrogenase molybdopterin-binding subunit B